MAYADPGNIALWENRYAWIRAIEEEQAGSWGSLLTSPQAMLLSYDVEIAFCAGAWASVIVLAHGAIDSTMREILTGDYVSNAKRLYSGDDDLHWLRVLRNRLVHVSPPESSRALPRDVDDDVAAYHETLEPHARRAVALLFRVIYAGKGT